MTNIEKKLDALIDALGFDVEEVRTGDQTPIPKTLGELRISQGCGYELCSYGGEYTRGPDDCYYTKEYITTNYKLTKKSNSKRNISAAEKLNAHTARMGQQ